jgi:hypothetical protein
MTQNLKIIISIMKLMMKFNINEKGLIGILD